ncbi:MAG: leucine-rich repeat domain-containing protein [Lachnospiraceae bacterium]|nr:leucine-rich repeat domain-containing protein [Lachnospiraceae bacterium]
MRDSFIKKISFVVLSIMLMVIMLPAVRVKAETFEGYIMVVDYMEQGLNDFGEVRAKEFYMINTWDPDKPVVTSYKGLSYNKSTNTITLKNADLKGVVLHLDATADFTVNVKGTNYLYGIVGMRAGIHFTGNGTLNLDSSVTISGEDKPFDDDPVIMLGDPVKKKILIDGDVTLNLVKGNGKDANLITIYDNGNEPDAVWGIDKLFVYKGVLSEKLKTDTSTDEWGGRFIYIKNKKLTIEPKLVKGKTYTVDKIKYTVTDVKNKKVEVAGTTKKTVKSVTIPATVKINGVKCKVTSIGDKAFKDYTKLTTFTCNSTSLTTIGEKAFYGDKKLAKYTFKSKKITKVGKNAFKNTKKGAKVKAPSKKLSAYEKLFKNRGLKSATYSKV